jgi:hypothetical protein
MGNAEKCELMVHLEKFRITQGCATFFKVPKVAPKVFSSNVFLHFGNTKLSPSACEGVKVFSMNVFAKLETPFYGKFEINF